MARTTPPRPPSTARTSKSSTVRAAAAAPSRRQRSKWQREQHQTRLLLLGSGALAVLLALILAAGWVVDNVVRPQDTVAEVAGDAITASQLLDAIRPQAQSIDAQVRRAGGSATSAVDQQKRQLPDQALTTLIQQRVMEQEASRRGISVSADDVEQRLQQTVAQQTAAAQPVPTAAADTSSGPTEATPVGTPTPLPTLAASAFTDGLQQLLTQTGLSETQLRDELRQSLLASKLQTAFGDEQVPSTQEQVHARHILVKTQDDANNVLQQLQGGADFAQLAQSTSVDPGSKDKGGDLGWFARGVMNKPFEDAAFALQTGQLSDVVQSPSGYHVIQVLERDPARAVDAAQLQSLRQQAFSTWLESKRTGQDVKTELSEQDRNWVLSRLGVRP
jgi:parvulin-like peptidyl-prolyl isomerase